MPSKFIVVFITAPSKKEAQAIVAALVKKRLAACGNVLNSVDSTFVWKGRVERAAEVLILLKSREDLFKKIAREVERLHSYDVPEIIAVPIVAGSKKYLEWIDENIKIQIPKSKRIV